MRAAGGYGTGRWFGDHVPVEHRRLQFQERIFDQDTTRVLDGLNIQPSWRCLELGAGAGSIARWLAERCPQGTVVATDVDPGYLDASWAPNLQVRRHDVTTEDFAAGSFDLIHVRYLMVYLPGREAVLTRAARWLAPGGWLVVEEPDAFTSDSSPYPAFRRLSEAVEQLLTATGADLRWARRLPIVLATVGLTGIGMSCSLWYAGDRGPGDELWKFGFPQLRAALVGQGLISDSEFDAALALFDDPSFVDLAPATISAWGRLPPAD
jgi:SAM-dependent methyltransferase